MYYTVLFYLLYYYIIKKIVFYYYYIIKDDKMSKTVLDKITDFFNQLYKDDFNSIKISRIDGESLDERSLTVDYEDLQMFAPRCGRPINL